MLGSTTNTGITNDADGETSSETGETDRETGTELDEASVQGESLLEVVGDKDRDDETVDTNNTSHDNGDNVLDDKVRSENTGGGNSDTRLGSSVRGTEASEDDSSRATHGAKEGRIDRASLSDLKTSFRHFEELCSSYESDRSE